MLRKSKLKNESGFRGFTLIEVMIVIAIIGILAAFAIPNFITYRDKGFCSAAESDANSISQAIASYFAISTNTSVSDASLQNDTTGKIHVGHTLTNKNTWHVDAEDINDIQISVTDATGRCPKGYQLAMNVTTSPHGYWDEGTYFKKITMK